MKPSQLAGWIVFASCSVAPNLVAADLTGDVSLLYFTEDKEAGVAAGFGTRTPSNHYVGVDLLYYQYTEIFSGGVSGSGTARFFASGVTYKYFIPLSVPNNIFFYFGGGIALTQTSVSATASAAGRTVSFSDTSSNDFGYQFLAGITLPLGSNASAKLGWRHLGVEQIEFKTLGIPPQSLNSNALEAGVHFRF